MSDDQHLVLAESRFGDIDHPRQRAFLTAYREVCNVRRAAEMADISRSSVYRWRDEDPQFAEAFWMAREDAADLLEAEAFRRAVDGVERETGWYKGEPGGVVREYSDDLLKFLLRGARPEKFADRRYVRSTSLSLDQDQLAQLPDHLLARIAEGEDPAAVLASAEEDTLKRIPGAKEDEDVHEADYTIEPGDETNGEEEG